MPANVGTDTNRPAWCSRGPVSEAPSRGGAGFTKRLRRRPRSVHHDLASHCTAVHAAMVRECASGAEGAGERPGILERRTARAVVEHDTVLDAGARTVAASATTVVPDPGDRSSRGHGKC